MDVRVVDPQNSHVCAAPGPALLDGLGGHVKHGHKGNRAARHSLGGEDLVVFGPYPGKGKPRAAAAFVDNGGMLYGFENAVDGIFNREHEAGGKLPELAARVHERGRVGHEVQEGHQVIELALGLLDFFGTFIFGVRLGDGPRNPPEQLLGSFQRLVVVAFDKVALLKYNQRVGSKFQGRSSNWRRCRRFVRTRAIVPFGIGGHRKNLQGFHVLYPFLVIRCSGKEGKNLPLSMQFLPVKYVLSQRFSRYENGRISGKTVGFGLDWALSLK